jgi:hypothetical protein
MQIGVCRALVGEDVLPSALELWMALNLQLNFRPSENSIQASHWSGILEDGPCKKNSVATFYLSYYFFLYLQIMIRSMNLGARG